jgi:hypothetical protein
MSLPPGKAKAAPPQPPPFSYDDGNLVCILNFTEANFTCNTNNSGYSAGKTVCPYNPATHAKQCYTIGAGVWEQTFPTGPDKVSGNQIVNSRFTWRGRSAMKSNSDEDIPSSMDSSPTYEPGAPTGYDAPQYSVATVFNPFYFFTYVTGSGYSTMGDICPSVDGSSCQAGCAPGAFFQAKACSDSGGCTCSSTSHCTTLYKVGFNGLPSVPTTVYNASNDVVAGALIFPGDATGTGAGLQTYEINNSFEFHAAPYDPTTSQMDAYMGGMLAGVVVSSTFADDPALVDAGSQSNYRKTSVYLLTRPNAVLLVNETGVDITTFGKLMIAGPPDITVFSTYYNSLGKGTPEGNVTNLVTDTFSPTSGYFKSGYTVNPNSGSGNSSVYIANSGVVLPNTFTPQASDTVCSIPQTAPPAPANNVAANYACPTNSKDYRIYFEAVPITGGPKFGTGFFSFPPDGVTDITTVAGTTDADTMCWPILQEIVYDNWQQYIVATVFTPVVITNYTTLTMDIVYTYTPPARKCIQRNLQLKADGGTATLPAILVPFMSVTFTYPVSNQQLKNLHFPIAGQTDTSTLMNNAMVCVSPPTSCQGAVGSTCPGPTCPCLGAATTLCDGKTLLYSDCTTLANGSNRFYAFGDVSVDLPSKYINVTMPSVSIANSTDSQTMVLSNIFGTAPVNVAPGEYASVPVADLAAMRITYVTRT